MYVLTSPTNKIEKVCVEIHEIVLIMVLKDMQFYLMTQSTWCHLSDLN